MPPAGSGWVMFSLSTVMRPAVSSVRTTASSGPCQVALSPIGRDVRPAPPLVIVTLMSFSVITPTLGLSLGLAAALRIVDALGCGRWPLFSTGNGSSLVRGVDTLPL